MSSINLGSFFGNWFSKPPKPSHSNSHFPNFAFINTCDLFSKNSNPNPNPISTSSTAATDAPPSQYPQMLDQFFWECDHRPDHRHTPAVDRILAQDSFFEYKPDPTPEEIEENKQWWEDFESSPVVQFLKRAEEITDKMNEMELKENERPYRKEDWKLWKKLPHVPGLDGRPMPRKAIKTRRESDAKFWDFARQFFFGLWGFRQRPYPPGRPIDVTQAIGYERLEKRYYDCEFDLSDLCLRLFGLIRIHIHCKSENSNETLLAISTLLES